jgi:predicted glutamine amidotransferase
MRRDLMLEVAPELFPGIQGSTDSEVLFHLALTYGLESDPVSALERAIGFVEATATRHGIDHAIQASVGISDGERIWAFRYSTQRQSRSLFVSAEVSAIKQLNIDNPRLARLRDEDRLIVSEPLADLPGVWTEIPESTVMIIQPGPDESRPFEPRYEPAAGNGAALPA